jgi:hypothetical protein
LTISVRGTSDTGPEVALACSEYVSSSHPKG